jgi:hypothetical protein
MAMGPNRYKTGHSGQGPVKSGGGYDSLKYNPTRQGTREKPATHKVSEEASAQLGASVGFRAPTLYQGQGYQPVKHGNELATNVGKGGPGTGRVTYASGSQGTHGAVAGNPSPRGAPMSREILGEFGPERK